MKKIGFIDYYLSEWHANNYPAWIEWVNQKNGWDFKPAYAWGEKDCSPVDQRTSDEWCEQFGVQKCATIEELCEKSDYILILAPSDPERHLDYAKKVFPFGKNTYIDKTFAPDFETAREIFALAGQNGAKFFSTSALRYASELEAIHDPVEISTEGGGSNLPEYAIHQIEMIVEKMNAEPKRVRVIKKADNEYDADIEFEGEKSAHMHFEPPLEFAIRAKCADGSVVETKAVSAYFKVLLETILRFYLTGEIPFDPQETLRVMKIRENVVKGMSRSGEWIDL